VRGCATLRAADWSRSSSLFGHLSVQTTERYVGGKQRIRSAVNDRIDTELAG